MIEYFVFAISVLFLSESMKNLKVSRKSDSRKNVLKIV